MKGKRYVIIERPYGKTLEEMAEIIAKDDQFYNDIGYGIKEAATSAIKALLGGEEQK